MLQDKLSGGAISVSALGVALEAVACLGDFLYGFLSGSLRVNMQPVTM